MSADIRMVPWSIARPAICHLRRVADVYYELEVWDEQKYRERHKEIDEMTLAQTRGREWLCDHGYLPESERGK